MLFRLVRWVVAFALRRFYRVTVRGAVEVGGPVVFVLNHPNALVDPALVFLVTSRPITFLAKAPLFQMPVLGALLRALGGLPVYRRQDDPAQMGRNDATLEAAAGALLRGRAISLFPEGKSHDEPQLAALKTGAARIALKACRTGADVRIVPVGLTYAEKNKFRSEVLIEVGAPIAVREFLPEDDLAEPEAVRGLTSQIAEGLSDVTLSLEKWEDLPLIKTAEALYSLRLGESPNDPVRQRRFARGLRLLRTEQPGRLEVLRTELASFHRRLSLIHASPETLGLVYRRAQVLRFAARNTAALLFGFPLFALGLALYSVPFFVGRFAGKILRVELDQQATVKLASALVISPVWVALLTTLAWQTGGAALGLLVLVGAVPHALFTRYFFEHRKVAWSDARTFFILGNRSTLKARLLVEGERLAGEVEALALELGPRIVRETG